MMTTESLKLGMVANTCNPNTWGATAAATVTQRVPKQSGINSKILW